MSAINDSGISLAENRTFRAFIGLYTAMSLLILLLLGTIYYRYKQEVMLSEHRLAMQLQSESYLPELRRWMQGDLKQFPKDLAYATALYDTRGRVIASHLLKPVADLKEQIGLEEGYIHFVILLSSYEMGELYLVLETTDDRLWFDEVLYTGLSVGVALFILLIVVGYWLSKLFLRPMRASIALLDDFIKDTTHELNTPVSAILTNIETLQPEALDEKSRKKINRIAIAAKTISTIYDDLTYLVLNHDLAVVNEPIDMTHMVRERLEYFQTRCEQKQLDVITELEAGAVCVMDRTRAVRLVDNLLSNAVKYNRMGGSIKVVLDRSSLCVSDSGQGIPQEEQQKVFERYQRADNSVGGFGIGLHIVAMIAKEYGLKIELDSKEGEGTAITVVWPSE